MMNNSEDLSNFPEIKNKIKEEEISFDSNEMSDPKEMKLTRKNLCEQWISDQSLLPPPEAMEINLSDNPKLSCKEMLRQLRSKRISDQIFEMHCEWNSCLFVTTDYLEFGRHVKGHLSDVQMKTYETGESLNICEWKECNFETLDNEELSRHVHFHSYHTKLKAIGGNVHVRYFLGECLKDPSQKNQIPELLSDFKCSWIGCTMFFNNIQEFFDHTQCHVIGIDPGQDGKFSCNWLGCNQQFPSLNKVKAHCRKHTGEKVVACFSCGGMFATNAMYEDHCVRQANTSEENRCETCGKFFSSERILRSHARRHINSFKCTYCDMTLSAPSALTKHIRYKHLNYRPFHCQYCTYMGVNKLDLHSHLLRHEGVPSSPRKKKTKKALLKEKELSKEKETNCQKIYSCHNCDKCFLKGHYLTKHLTRHHGYNQLSETLRMRYELCDDGYYRLIPVRYESVDLSAEMEDQDYKNINLEKDAEEFKVLKCFEGNEEKPATFVVVPSSVEDPESYKDALMAHREDKMSKRTNKNADTKNNKNTKAKNSRKSTSKNTKSKRIKMETDQSEPVANIISNEKSNSENAECSAPSPLNSVNSKLPSSIVISIAHVDEEGKVIKKEIIKSEEIVI